MIVGEGEFSNFVRKGTFIWDGGSCKLKMITVFAIISVFEIPAKVSSVNPSTYRAKMELNTRVTYCYIFHLLPLIDSVYLFCFFSFLFSFSGSTS